jgi:hypothetical protein
MPILPLQLWCPATVRYTWPMGTWGPGILGNDTSCEVHETVLEAYNAGAEVRTLVGTIRQRFATELSLPGAKNDVLFGLALGLWEIGALDAALRRQVAAIVASGDDLTAWEEAQAKPELVAARKKELAKFVKKLEVSRKVPKARKPPPAPIETPFAPGACFSFRFPDESFGGVVVIEASFTKGRGRMALCSTDLACRAKPTMADFGKARLLNFRWSAPFDEQHSARCAASNGKVANISAKGLAYEKAADRAVYLERCAGFFEVVGHLPPLSRVLLGTTGFGNQIEASTTAADLRRGLAKELRHDFEEGIREKARHSPPLAKLAEMVKR